MILGDLEKADVRTDEWAADLQVLQEDVEHHIGEEEDDLFPKIKKLLSGAKSSQRKPGHAPGCSSCGPAVW
jgi:iron-sulfur cluster repair protein YtfE (RIC family)